VYTIAWATFIRFAMNYAINRYVSGSPNRLPDMTRGVIWVMGYSFAEFAIPIVLAAILLLSRCLLKIQVWSVWYYVLCITVVWLVVLAITYWPLIIGYA